MGTWGTRIYEDDTVLDIRGDFLDMIAKAKPIEEIERLIRINYDDYNDKAESDLASLAIACVELETGTLTDQAKADALEVISSGRDYDRWLEEASKEDAGLRKRELTLIRKYLEAYDGKPVQRKSWKQLQADPHESQDSDGSDDKLDDVGWHVDSVTTQITEAAVNDRAGAHIACFIYWLVSRGLFEDAASKGITDRSKLTMQATFDFLDTQLDGTFMATDIVAEVRPFAVQYYGLTGGNTEGYLWDYAMQLPLNRKLYDFVPTTVQAEKLARVLDKRLQTYRTKGLIPIGHVGRWWQIWQFWFYALLSVGAFTASGLLFWWAHHLK